MGVFRFYTSLITPRRSAWSKSACMVLLVVASLATRLVLRGGKQARTLLQWGANLSGLPLVPFLRHDLAAFILNPVLCARRKLFEGPLDQRGLLHGGVPRPFIWHSLYVAVFSTTDTKSHRFFLSLCCLNNSQKSSPTSPDYILGDHTASWSTGLHAPLRIARPPGSRRYRVP